MAPSYEYANTYLIVAGLLMLGFRCLDMDSAYRAIHWPSLVLIVGMLPFSLALQRTGDRIEQRSECRPRAVIEPLVGRQQRVVDRDTQRPTRQLWLAADAKADELRTAGAALFG